MLCLRHRPAELGFVLRELCVDILLELAALDDVLAIALEEVIDRFDADANRSRQLVFVEILEGKAAGDA